MTNLSSNIIGVRFFHPQRPDATLSAKTYHYKVTEEQAKKIKKDSYVVVDVPITGGLCVVKVVTEPTSVAVLGHLARKYIVDVVDLDAYREVERRTIRIAEIKEQLEQRAKAVSDVKRYEHLASIDDAAATLLSELKQLDAA